MTCASMIKNQDTILAIGTRNPSYHDDDHHNGDKDEVDDVDDQGPALLPAPAHLGGALHCGPPLSH